MHDVTAVNDEITLAELDAQLADPILARELMGGRCCGYSSEVTQVGLINLNEVYILNDLLGILN